MPYIDLYVKEDDERPELADTLEDQQGTAIDLSTSVQEVRLYVRHEDSDTLVVNAVATIDNASQGEVSYSFADGELDTVGYHAAEWEILWNDGDEQTIPPNRDIGIQVGESVEGNGVVGSVANAAAVVTKSTDYTASTREVVLVDASGGPVAITLPSPDGGDLVWIKKIDASTNAVTIRTPGTETVDGTDDPTITNQYTSRTITSDGSNYFII